MFLLFSAGADIKSMQNLDFQKASGTDFIGHWTKVSECTKPIIAAVNGVAVSNLMSLLQYLRLFNNMNY